MFRRHPLGKSRGRLRLRAAALPVLGILFLSACSSSKPVPHFQDPAQASGAVSDKCVTRSIPPAAGPLSDLRQIVPFLAEKPLAPEPPASAVSKLLPKSCLVMEMTPTTLLVRSGRPTAQVSLFEEAIALSKLRGILSAKSSIPKAGVQKTALRNGTAVIPFGKSVPPADSAAAITSALTVDGVQRVHALLDAD